jgi:thiamine biosynthesis lipoprotein
VPDTIQISRRSLFALPAVAAVAACQGGSRTIELGGATMGTTYNIVAIDHDGKTDEAALHADVRAALADVNLQMSNWDAGSDVSRFNAATSDAAIAPELAQLVRAAQDVNAASDGQFDITLGPVIEAWGFGAAGNTPATPDAATLQTAMNAAGQTGALRIENGRLYKDTPETGIYLSSIGKGHGVDRVADVLRNAGLVDFMVEIGGDLYVAGRNREQLAWQIGIETPDAGNRAVQQIAKVSDLGMATSGDYRNFFVQDGQRLSHIIDATTGRPVTHDTASVTVLAENAMLADAWATALLALGTKRGLEVAAQQNLAALFIDRDGESFKTVASDRFAALQA